MEASGGYEREWAKALRQADIEARIVDPRRVRDFARSAGQLAKNEAIDAEMIAWFAETFTDAPDQVHDAARENLVQVVKARQSLLDLQTSLKNRGRACRTQGRPADAGSVVEADRRRSCQARGCDRRDDQGRATFGRICRDNRERAWDRQDYIRRTGRRNAGTWPGQQQDRRCAVGSSSLR